MLAHYWSEYMQNCLASEDTLVTLQTLRERGQKLGVITNGPVKLQQQKLDALGITRLFETIVISEAEAVRKPDPAIFARALERCGVVCDEAVFVGDHPEIDIAGAHAAGMRPIWKYVPYWKLTVPDVPVVKSLREILPICL
jgi:putative hydrolase of the HAD superfamily